MKTCAEEHVAPQQAVLVAAAAVAVGLLYVSKHRVQHTALSALALNILVGFARQRGHIYFYIGQPVGLLLVAAVVVKKHGQAADLLGALYLVVTAVLTPALEPCTDSWWIYAPDVLGAVYLLFGVATRYDALYPAWCLAESGFLAVLLAQADKTEVVLRAEHLTWWSIMLFGVWDAAIFCEYYVNCNVVDRKVDIVRGFTPTVFVLNSVVLLGVYFMSAASCDLLSDALAEAGPALYIAGNFAMHYYPVLRTVFAPSHHTLTAMGKGAAIAVLYAIAYPATEVYGCSTPDSNLTVSLVGSVAIAFSLLYALIVDLWQTHTQQKLQWPHLSPQDKKIFYDDTLKNGLRGRR